MAEGESKPAEPADEPVREAAPESSGAKVVPMPGAKPAETAIVAPPAKPPPPAVTGAESQHDPPPQQRHAARDLLLVGTYVSGVLVLACIVGALYLCLTLISLVENGVASGVNLRLLMSCVACFVAMAFACLGFGLFLIQARGAFSASHGKGEVRTSIESTAPGLIAIVCATVVMYLALDGNFKMGGSPPVGSVQPGVAPDAGVTATATWSVTPDAAKEDIPW